MLIICSCQRAHRHLQKKAIHSYQCECAEVDILVGHNVPVTAMYHFWTFQYSPFSRNFRSICPSIHFKRQSQTLQVIRNKYSPLLHHLPLKYDLCLCCVNTDERERNLKSLTKILAYFSYMHGAFYDGYREAQHEDVSVLKEISNRSLMNQSFLFHR